MNYLNVNHKYWNGEYNPEHVESYIFRGYNRYLQNIKGKTLDFGCSTGAVSHFFKEKGFDVYGVDISNRAIEVCQSKMPDIKDHFRVITTEPVQNYFDTKFDLITAGQSLYYFSDSDLAKCLSSLYDQMNTGGIIFASMVGKRCWWFDISEEYKDGLCKVVFSSTRFRGGTHYLNFTHSKKQLEDKFKIFKKLHIGYYDAYYLESEGSEFHYMFVGVKA